MPAHALPNELPLELGSAQGCARKASPGSATPLGPLEAASSLSGVSAASSEAGAEAGARAEAGAAGAPAAPRAPRASPPRPPGPVDSYASAEGRARRPGALRALAAATAGAPGLISLAAGFPPPALFPLSGLALSLAAPGAGAAPPLALGAAAAAACQQYNSALRGAPALLPWVEARVAAAHAPPPLPHHAAREVVVCDGANHALELIFSLFLDRGDAFLCEEFTYPVVLDSIAAPKGLRALGVAADGAGLVPAALRAALAAAAAAAAAGGLPRPKLLYTVPTGQNPTGATASEARRRAVYAICREFDCWIVEDDPYCWLRYGGALALAQAQAAAGGAAAALEAAVPGLELAAGSAAPPSYLALDADGRVLRVDSFSKFLAPGLRLGWVTARADVAKKLTWALHASTVGPSGLAQGVAGALLAAWGAAGLDAHLRRCQAHYAAGAAAAGAAAARHLAGLTEWRLPEAGMFLWVRLTREADAGAALAELRAAGVAVVPGGAMRAAGGGAAGGGAGGCPFFRLSFSSASAAELEEGVARLGAVLHRRAGLAAA
jgi:DNA-binding transcriptional MocR family regulator